MAVQAQDSRAVDAALTSLGGKVFDMKQSVAALLVKLEREVHNWPSILDNFTALSAHASNLLKQLRNDKTPELQNLVILPLDIRNELDRHLEQKTEGRVGIFHHEIVPDYLRTKLDLSLEQHNQEWLDKSSSVKDADADAQLHNSRCDEALKLLSLARDDWPESSVTLSATTRQDEAETLKIVLAMAPVAVPAVSSKSGKSAAAMRAQSSAKGDLKAAANAATHPYARPSSSR